MKKKKKKIKNKRETGKNLPIKSKILKILKKSPRKNFSHEHICVILKVHSPKVEQLVGEILGHLKTEGVLETDKKGKYSLKSSDKYLRNKSNSEIKSEPEVLKREEKDQFSEKPNDKNSTKLSNKYLRNKSSDKSKSEFQKRKHKRDKSSGLIGRIRFTQRGFAFVEIEGAEKDIYIHKGNSLDAFNGDLVEIRISEFKGKTEGQVINVIERARETYVGTIHRTETSTYVIPDDKNMPEDFFIGRKDTMRAKLGEKVIVKYLSWPNDFDNPVAKVIDILGMPGDKNVDMFSILADNGLPYEFPDQVIKESEKIAQGDYSSIENRRDMRDTLTFTIDPEDAKDFDDALSYKKLENGNVEVGIHIADVSHFVTPGSALDKEAFQRGNSVYLVDRVVPMLPEVLSNKLCSLRPNEEKLTFSAIFELDENAEIVNEWFGKTAIYSDCRFAYEQAQEIIEGKEDEKFSEPILCLDKLAKILRKNRLALGALNIESEEVRFELNEDNHPIGLKLKVSKCANKLIEEFMLLANKRVAIHTGGSDEENKTPFVYRVHAEPNPEKIADLKIFLQQFGYVIETKEKRPLATALNNILEEAKGKDEIHIIGPMVVRSMSNAVYDTNNIGHYGLAFEHYTHFTSPIRRYADLLVHRILDAKLGGTKFHHFDELNSQCQHISETEKSAAKAERASTKFMQVKFMSDKIGKTYSGIITGVTDWGIFIEISETKCEGLVHISSLDGSFKVNKETKKLESAKLGVSYHLGQKIDVTVKGVNEAKKQIDLVLGSSKYKTV